MTTTNYTVGSAPDYPPYSNSTFLNNNDFTEDVYNFSTSQTSSINLNLHNISANDDVDLELYRDVNGDGVLDSGDQLIEGSYKGGNNDDFINRLEPVGNYLAKVYWFDLGSDNHLDYKLDLSVTPESPLPAEDPAQASNLIPNEVEVGHLVLNSLESQTINHSGWVGNSNTVDTYNFSASGSNDGVRIDVSLTGLSSDADIRLIQDTNQNQIVDLDEVIASSSAGGVSDDSFSRYVDNFELANNDYFVQVYQYSGETSYDLSMSFESVIA